MANKTFQRFTAKRIPLATLQSRFEPIYDNTFDDLIEKLNKIDLNR